MLSSLSLWPLAPAASQYQAASDEFYSSKYSIEVISFFPDKNGVPLRTPQFALRVSSNFPTIQQDCDHHFAMAFEGFADCCGKRLAVMYSAQAANTQRAECRSHLITVKFSYTIVNITSLATSAAAGMKNFMLEKVADSAGTTQQTCIKPINTFARYSFHALATDASSAT